MINQEKHQTKPRPMPKAADYLQGQSPRARGHEKVRDALQWIYSWGFSTNDMLCRLLNIKSKDYAGRLVKAGLLRKTRTAAGGFVPGMPIYYYTLSELGLQTVESVSPSLIRYKEVDPYRVAQHQMRHSLIAQEYLHRRLTQGGVAEWASEREYGEPDEPGQKRPDFVWWTDKGHKVAVEIELNGKFDRLLDQFTERIHVGLSAMNPEFSGVEIVSTSQDLLDRYKSKLSKGASYYEYTKDTHGFWRQGEKATINLDMKIYYRLHKE